MPAAPAGACRTDVGRPEVPSTAATTKSEVMLEIEVIPTSAFDWTSQANQYREQGEPGIHLERRCVDIDSGAEVCDVDPALAGPRITVTDCLLYRDGDGTLIGILNHYDGRSPLERKGGINIWVRPDRQRQGVGTALVLEALRRWDDILPESQRYTEAGLAFLKSLIRRGEEKLAHGARNILGG